jgi:hypothetical protein
MEQLVSGIESIHLSVEEAQALSQTLSEPDAQCNISEAFTNKKNIGQTMLTLALRVKNRLFLNQEEIAKVEWTNGESNLDTEFSALACRYAEEEWISLRDEIPTFQNLEMKACHPDITCHFTMKGDDGVEKKQLSCPPQKIELKSSMKTSITGSTSKSLEVNIPIIYCLRPNNKKQSTQSSNTTFYFECGQYIDSMLERGDYDMFQDRSPRPRISFSSLQKVSRREFADKSFPFDDYIHHLAKCSLRRIHSSQKQFVKSSWQDKLVVNIVKLVLDLVLEQVSKELCLDERNEYGKLDVENFVKHILAGILSTYRI